MKTTTTQTWIALMLGAAFILQSCGNIDIVKRRYRPGFHVEVSKKQQERKQVEGEFVAEEASVNKSENQPTETATDVSAAEQTQIVWPDAELTASADNAQTPATSSTSKKSQKATEILFAPFREMKQEKLNGELRRAVFNREEDEKHGWSVISFISTGLGAVGLGMVIAGLALLVSFIFAGGFIYWWIFAIVGVVFGIAGMVTGILGMRETGRGEKRGRGFAMAGMISGIVSLAMGLIGLIWGLIYTFIQRINDN